MVVYLPFQGTVHDHRGQPVQQAAPAGQLALAAILCHVSHLVSLLSQELHR